MTGGEPARTDHDDLFSTPAAPVADALTPAWPERAAWGTAPSLRAWQQAAVDDYRSRQPRDFLAVATPGAGETTFALTVAADLLGRRIVDRITVVAPTEHLKTQWAEAAARAGIPIDPTYSAGKGRTSDDYVGIAVTYAGVAVNPLAMRIHTERFKTLVILDEVHHAGDALSWGEGVREAFEPAANARYAVKFLRQLKDKTGSWETASTWYHSANPEHGTPYRAMVVSAMAAEARNPAEYASLPDAPAPQQARSSQPVVSALRSMPAGPGTVVYLAGAPGGRILPQSYPSFANGGIPPMQQGTAFPTTAMGGVGRSLAAYRMQPVPMAGPRLVVSSSTIMASR